MTACRALLLDLDGTLADSLGAMRGAYASFMARFGAQGSDAEFAQINGPPLPDIVARLKQAHGFSQDSGELLTCYRSLVRQSYGHVTPNPGAKELLETAVGNGWRTAVVTSNAEELAEHWLAEVGLGPLIDAVVGFEQAERGKPHPDPYLAGLRKTGAAATESIAVEDSVQGAAAALAAGIETFVYDPEGQFQFDCGLWPSRIEGSIRRLDALTGKLRR